MVNDRVVGQQDSKSASSFPIPRDGYLLVLRSFDVGTALATGSALSMQTVTSPTQLNEFPNIVGAGPLLVQNSQVVLNAAAEQFKPPFDTQAAPRSGIGQRADGTILLAAAHNRINGPGPTLREWAEIMRQLGATQALNLDGGSSTRTLPRRTAFRSPSRDSGTRSECARDIFISCSVVCATSVFCVKVLNPRDVNCKKIKVDDLRSAEYTGKAANAILGVGLHLLLKLFSFVCK